MLGSQDAYGITIETDFPMTTVCTNPPNVQLCVPTFSTTVETDSLLQVQYFVPQTHCSSVRVNIFLDGNPVHTTGFLSWFGAPSPFDSLPLDSGIIDLGAVTPGMHTIDVQAEGQVSGCNSGGLGAWEGTLKVFSWPLEESEIIGGEIIPINTTALLLAGVQSISMWMIPVLAGIGIGVFVIKRRS